ncbi:MAG TPA: hypothetical protein VGN18_05095 [Jatrophihabitans sp.]|jgi:hypothetical protein|uniref:hypothetical protein n=1 Tax=Jatrophihabitans sp. TaxID=1932789 RepID=UPI002DF793C5|nr:hypothetical protein [Jatrophihabitans sp.]
MLTKTAERASTTRVVPTRIPRWSDLELCEAMYWIHRSRARGDAARLQNWTDRMNALLDWRLVHGPDRPF